jgi:sulfite reductase (NADPH) flavoprotein alpha-component
MLFQLISYITGGERRQKAKALAAGEDPDGDAATLDVLAAVAKFPGIRPDPEAFVECLEGLQPRLYSISSSPRINASRLSLTVDHVRYEIGGEDRARLGVASTFLSRSLVPGTPLKVYVQRAHNFALPANPATPIVMVGPGTGVAPFRAFVQERRAAGAGGRNWLFFGDRSFTHDFLYQLEWQDALKDGALTRMDVAFSRDQPEKVYVQHRIWEQRRDLIDWLDKGAYFYVCGDMNAMAKDVRAMLVRAYADVKALTPEAAEQAVRDIEREKRYLQDVY